MTQKRILIIPSVKSLNEIVKKYSKYYDIVLGSFNNIEITFNNDVVSVLFNGEDLKTFDFIWLSSNWTTRSIAYAIDLYLTKYNIKHTNTEKNTSKITDQMLLALSGIKTPDTWCSAKYSITQFTSNIENICNYPMVIKDTLGSCGRYSSFISNYEDLLFTSKSLPDSKKYMYQKYIPNEYEWGILISNYKIVSAEKSYPMKGEYRNNSCNGATEKFININDIPKEISKLAITSAKILELNWCRVDILEHSSTKTPYVLEVNRFPGVTSNSDEVFGVDTYLKEILGVNS